MHLVARFLIGGCLVSLFAIVADVLRPKSFAGLFGAAPSIALAVLTLTILSNGAAYAALEARSMTVGALAFLAYAAAVSRWLMRHRWPVLLVSVGGLLVWLALALGVAALLWSSSA